MDKEKEIEALTDVLIANGVFNNLVCRQDYAYPEALVYDCCRSTAEVVIDAGYSNVKQAVKEFAEELKCELEKYRIDEEKQTSDGCMFNSSHFCIEVIGKGGLIDKLIEKIYGEEK